MQITVSQRALRDALRVVARASAGPRTALPVLANVLLSAEAGRLKLTATDLEIAITCRLDAQVTQPGAITVPTRTFTDLTCTASHRGALRRGAGEVVFAAATDEGRMMLTGVLATFENDGLILAASDGFRLAVSRARLPVEVIPPVTALIPATPAPQPRAALHVRGAVPGGPWRN